MYSRRRPLVKLVKPSKMSESFDVPSGCETKEFAAISGIILFI